MRAAPCLLLLAAALAMTPSPARATPQLITFAERELFESPGNNIISGNLDESPLPELVGVRGGDVLIRRNLGGRRFADAIVVTMASGTVHGPILADLNGNGRLDLVVWQQAPAALFVRMNLGGLTFGPTTTYPIPNEPSAITAGDLNGDSRDDLVVLWPDTFTSYLSAVDGSLAVATSQTITSSDVMPVQILGQEVADIDGDGAPDLAISLWRGHNYAYEWYPGTGDGSFAPVRAAIQQFGVGPLVDLDHDGDLDRVQSDGASVTLNLNDSGTFASSGLISLDRTRVTYDLSVAVCDLDKDGFVDVVLAGYWGGTAQQNSLAIVVYAVMDSSLRHVSGWHVPYYPYGLQVADLDGDTYLDIAVHSDDGLDNPLVGFSPFTRPTAVLWNDGHGALAGKLEIPLQTPAGNNYEDHGLLAIQAGPGLPPDLLGASWGALRLLRNRGNGQFGRPTPVGRGKPRAAADLDGDGIDELIVTTLDSIWVYRRVASGEMFFALAPIATPMRFLGAADFDGDGVLDLGLESTDGSLWARSGDGACGFGPPRNLGGTLPSYHGGVILEDLNSDGRADIAMTEAPALEGGDYDNSYYQSVMHVLLNDGAGLLTSDVTDTLTFYYPRHQASAEQSSLATGDVDGDGDRDIAVRVFSRSNSSWFGAFLNDGSGAFDVAGPARYGGIPGGLLVCGDFNGDGLADLLLHDQDGLDFDFRPLESIGGGQFGAFRTLVGMHQAGDLVAADFDHDGRSDAAILDIEAGSVGIMFNSTPFGPTPTQLSLVSARVVDDAIQLEWIAPGPEAFSAQLERSDGNAWATIATLTSDGLGQIRYRDTDVTRGARYGYRLRYRDGARELLTAESWVELPALAFALRAPSPSPVRGMPAFGVSLPARGDAALEILDIAGRRVRTQRLSGLAPGDHRVQLEGAPLAPGLYFARLRLAEASARVRFVVIR